MSEKSKARNALTIAQTNIRITEEDRSVSVDEVEPAFAAKLFGQRDTLSGILRGSRQFGGQPVVGGVMFTSLLSDLCETVNQGAKDIVPLVCVCASVYLCIWVYVCVCVCVCTY